MDLGNNEYIFSSTHRGTCQIAQQWSIFVEMLSLVPGPKRQRVPNNPIWVISPSSFLNLTRWPLAATKRSRTYWNAIIKWWLLIELMTTKYITRKPTTTPGREQKALKSTTTPTNVVTIKGQKKWKPLRRSLMKVATKIPKLLKALRGQSLLRVTHYLLKHVRQPNTNVSILSPGQFE